MKTIAIYPGSFNPMHIGHINILEKAERIFGRGNVLIAVGVNPDKLSTPKSDEDLHLLEQRINRKIITYNKFLHELIEDYEKEGYKVVIIRGLRNGVDLDYEVNQYRFVDDFKKDVNVIYLTCDREYEHISSSAIRKIEQFGGPDMTKQYLV
jgi:pantetheine-phosphate adenylyltransferase